MKSLLKKLRRMVTVNEMQIYFCMGKEQLYCDYLEKAEKSASCKKKS